MTSPPTSSPPDPGSRPTLSIHNNLVAQSTPDVSLDCFSPPGSSQYTHPLTTTELPTSSPANTHSSPDMSSLSLNSPSHVYANASSNDNLAVTVTVASDDSTNSDTDSLSNTEHNADVEASIAITIDANLSFTDTTAPSVTLPHATQHSSPVTTPTTATTTVTTTLPTAHEPRSSSPSHLRIPHHNLCHHHHPPPPLPLTSSSSSSSSSSSTSHKISPIPTSKTTKVPRTHQSSNPVLNTLTSTQSSSSSSSARPISPFRMSVGARHSLTLKEQNSKVDKLTKENFDLKLKIYFLDQALQRRSEEGVRELVQENVQLHTDLTNEKKESQILRKRAREAERRCRLLEDQLRELRHTGALSSSNSSADSSHQLHLSAPHSPPKLAQPDRDAGVSTVVNLSPYTIHQSNGTDNQVQTVKMWKDLLESESARREQADREVQTLREELNRVKLELFNFPREFHRTDKLGQNQPRRMETAGAAIIPTKSSPSISSPTKAFAVLKNHDGSVVNHNNQTTGSADDELTVVTVDSAQTLVEKLRHENAELRRDLGAQTSMLTSRNRERERLQAEIENLRLASRRGTDVSASSSTCIMTTTLGGNSGSGINRGSITGIPTDMILDRSASRTGVMGNGTLTLGSGGCSSSSQPGTGINGIRLNCCSDVEKERDELEQKLSYCREDMARIRMINQELESELNVHLDILQQMEKETETLVEERERLREELQSALSERDELMVRLNERERDIETVRAQALSKFEEVNDKLQRRERELDDVLLELEAQNEDFGALQHEMNQVTRCIMQFEEDSAEARRRIETLESELVGAHEELERADGRLAELQGKNERLEVQIESNQDEIGFLREEQEADKIKIGELEASLATATSKVTTERERCEEIEARLNDERRQHELLKSQEKAAVQKMLTEINGQALKNKEECRRLRASLSAAEVQSALWKDLVKRIETGLRQNLGLGQRDEGNAVGSTNGENGNDGSGSGSGSGSGGVSGSDSSVSCAGEKAASGGCDDVESMSKILEMVEGVGKVHKQVVKLMSDVDKLRNEGAEKERLLRSRDSLLESSGLESRRLSELLDKERQARIAEQQRLEQAQRSQQTISRTLQAHETRMLELETTRCQDKRRIATLEQRYKEQVGERNKLLVSVWKRLSGLCGKDWTGKHSLVDGESIPTVEMINKNVNLFARNLLLGVRTVEGIIARTRKRIEEVEREFEGKFEGLENWVEANLGRIEKLERRVEKCDISSSYVHGKVIGTRDDCEGELGKSGGDRIVEGVSLGPITSLAGHDSGRTISVGTAQMMASEQRWIHRLKELERRLKMEREARLLDRSGARKRIEEEQAENMELRSRLERLREENRGHERAD